MLVTVTVSTHTSRHKELHLVAPRKVLDDLEARSLVTSRKRPHLFYPRSLDWRGVEGQTPYPEWPTHPGEHVFEVCLVIGIVVGYFRHKQEFWTVPSVTANARFGQCALPTSNMLI